MSKRCAKFDAWVLKFQNVTYCTCAWGSHGLNLKRFKNLLQSFPSKIQKFKGALDKCNIIPQFFSKHLDFFFFLPKELLA